MKNAVLRMFLVLLAVAFTVGCNGGSATSPDESAGQTKLSFSGGTLYVTNAYRDGALHDLVTKDGEVESMPESTFSKFVVTGDFEGWRTLAKYTVGYSGGANVSVSGLRSGDKVNGYFGNPDGKEYWLDLGKAACVSGCEIIFEKAHSRHIIRLF